jgi:4-hydroxybutyryl-CoA dehydratase/vinylacetyl-CoA-Delta-isomerase
MDLSSPATGKYVEKYFKGLRDVSTEDCIRIPRLIENMTECTTLVEYIHGAGSPQAQRIMYLRLGELEHKTALAKKLASISGR